jgi:competence protein ComEA
MARQAAVLSASTPENGAPSSLKTAPLININTASRAELEKLPGIGTGLAARIIAHREQFGAFRRTEHLIVVRGISERRFLGLREYVTVE